MDSAGVAPHQVVVGHRRLSRARPTWARVLSLAVAAVDLAFGIMVHVGTHGVARVILGTLFVLIVPGWAIMGFGRIRDAGVALALTLGLSLAAVTSIAQLLLSIHRWRVDLALQGAAGACLILLSAQIALNALESRRRTT